MDRGHLNLQKLGELLIEASKRPRDDKGMVISATGVLTIAARALKDLAAPMDATEPDADALREDHENLIGEAQPNLAAFSLETMARHFTMLRAAVEAGDAIRVGEIFNLYVFD